MLQGSLLKVVEFVRANFSAAPILAPSIVFAQATDGETVLGDLFPVLALCLIGQRNSTIGNGENELRMCVGCSFLTSQARKTNFFKSLFGRIRLVKALYRALAYCFGSRFWGFARISD